MDLTWSDLNNLIIIKSDQPNSIFINMKRMQLNIYPMSENDNHCEAQVKEEEWINQ